MTILLMLASFEADTMSVMAICGGLCISIIALAIASYRAKFSIVPILIAGYVVLFASTFVTASYFIVPLSIVALFAMGIWLTFYAIISTLSIIIFGGITFFLSIVGFIADG